MTKSKDQVPKYQEIQSYKALVEQAKKEYLLRLISLGYVFEQQGMYESTTYWAIHKDYYKTPEERYLDDDDFDGTVTPDYFPVGAFIKINSIAESETEDPWETQYLLSESRCYLDYLSLKFDF